MALECTGTQRLVNGSLTLPATGYPFTVGCWARLPAFTVQHTLWCLSDTGTTNNTIRALQSGATNMRLAVAAGGVENNVTATGQSTAGGWYFWLCRLITSANRWITILNPNGSVASIQGTTARAPVGIDTMTIGALNTSGGASEGLIGGLGEFWYTNNDAFQGAAAVDVNRVYQLAYSGPFAVADVAANLVEYRSLRGNFMGIAGETWGGGGWAAPVPPLNGENPPLPYSYVRPGDMQRKLII